MRPIADLSKLLRAMHATPRQLALQIWTDEHVVQLMTLTFEIKRAERRFAAHRSHLRNSHVRVSR